VVECGTVARAKGSLSLAVAAHKPRRASVDRMVAMEVQPLARPCWNRCR
jgi:hypothetical protein